MFEITDSKGIQMTFENGWTISIQFGYGNYCDNQTNKNACSWFEKETYSSRFVSSTNAEIAIWKGDRWYDFNADDPDFASEKVTDSVKGWCSPDEVAYWISRVSKW